MSYFQDNNDKELHALISLLDEPNMLMFGKVRERILSYGLEAIPILENTWDSCFDDIIQQRIENLIHKIQFGHTFNEFRSWALDEKRDLLDGYFLIAQYAYPELEREDIDKMINVIKKDVWLELNDNLTALEQVKVINHIIFDIHKFKANRRSIRTIQNHFLNNLLDTKKGSNLSLGILYLIIVQDFGIPIYGVDLPRHFILTYTKTRKHADDKCFSEDDALFYINPFTKGTVITAKEVELFITQLNLPSEPSFYCPCDEVTIIKRLLSDLMISYNKQGFPEKVKELEKLLGCLPE